MATFTGGCACGAVRYEIAADPLMQVQCQCRKCQQLSGTGHANILAFPKPAAKVTGALKHWSYVADSGATATRGFCPTCGSQISGGTSGFPDFFTVQAGSLDDPSGFAPQVVVYAECGQAWDKLAEGLPRFPKMPPM